MADPAPNRERDGLRHAIEIVLLAVLYAVVARFGLTLGAVGNFATLVWAPTGISLAALLLHGNRVAPGVFLGAFVANAWTGASFAVALGIAAGNTLEALLGASALRAVGGSRALSGLRSVLALIIPAALLSTLVSAAVGVTSLWLGGLVAEGHFFRTFRAWWIGDVLGDLVVAPFLLSWAPPLRVPKRSVLEVIALTTVLVVFIALVFLSPHGAVHPFELQYGLFPLFIWAAVRFRLPGATAATLVASLIAIWGTVQGSGPFVRDTLTEGLLSLQAFMGFGALSPLVVAGAMSDRARLEREARKQAARRESRFRILSSASRAFVETNLQVPALFEAIARHIAEAIGDTCAIRLSTEEDAHPELVALHRSPRSESAARRDAEALEATQNSSLVVVRSGSPLRIAEIDESSPGRPSGSAWPIHSLLVVPLRSRESVVGSITLWREAPGAPYTVDDQNLLEELADRAGLALYNARLHEYLESAVQTRDDFLAIAGHELKTPLAALIMQLQSVQRALERNPSKVPERVERATKSGFRLERLINQLLDVSRIRAGRLRLEAESVRLDELVKDVVARFVEASAKPEPPISVRCDEAVEGHWDRFRIDQVVDNLVGNAVKYGQGKPIEVDLRVQDGMALLRVVDHGIGIRPEHQKKIFQRFERATGTRDFGGLGLGLWISSQIVEASGGAIEVESAAGSGSTFTVRLPLKLPA